MNAKELRIGNYVFRSVYSFCGKSSVITKITCGSTLNLIEKDASICDPIPLTPEILEKCLNGSANGIELANNVWLVIHLENGEANIYDIYKNETLQLKIHCKYLHQLQNLYFTLKGEELNIKI